MTLIVGGRYLRTSGAFARATRLRRPGLYRGLEAQMRREIGWSLASAAIYGIPAGIVAWGWQAQGWTRIYSGVGDYPLCYLPVSLLAYLLLPDTCRSEERRVGKECVRTGRFRVSAYHYNKK